MYTIEVDFDVYKQLTVRRSSEDVSCNDVIRDLLGIKASKVAPAAAAPNRGGGEGDWVTKGIRFPAGTEFRARHKGRTHMARIEGGALMLDGHRYDSPSAAAVSVTKTSVNGWRFWECRLPGKSSWQLIEMIRKSG